MPYIKHGSRGGIADAADRLSVVVTTPGELNYAITRLVHDYLLRGVGATQWPDYAKLNEAIGVLECAKLELYRTVVTPYEAQKRLENGVVSMLDQEAP